MIKCMIVIILIIIIILYIDVPYRIDYYKYNKVVKKIDKTQINLIDNEWTSDFAKRFRKHEPKSNIELKKCINNLPNNSYIIDAGAHVGDTGLYLATILKNNYPNKNIKVIMIDPDKSKLDFIKDMAIYNNLINYIRLENYGIGNRKYRASINKDSHAGGWTLEENINGDILIDKVDNICKNDNISLMHLDVEGMEYDALLGSQNIIQNVKYIMIELNKLSERQKEYDFLSRNNFELIKDLNRENGNKLFKKINS